MKAGLIEQYMKQVSLENHTTPESTFSEMEVIEDNEPTAWIEHPESSLDDHRAVGTMVESLDELASKVDNAPEVAVEAYCTAFNAIVGKELAPREAVSVESISASKKPAAALAERIRKHSSDLKYALVMSLEEFNKGTYAKFKETVATYKKARAQLDKVEDNVDRPDKVVKVNHERVWKMFNRDNKFVKPEAIKDEVRDVAKVVSALRSGVTSGQMPSMKLKLMMNTTVFIENGQVKFDAQEPPAPKKEFAGTDYAWLAFWGLFFGPLGLIGALIFKNKSGSEADRDRGTKEMHSFIDTIKHYDKTITELEGVIKQASQMEDKEVAGNILEGAMAMTKHITDMTYGAAVLFTKVANA